MPPRSAPEIASAVSRTLRDEFPELSVRDSVHGDGRIADELVVLVRWLTERVPVDERLARVGGLRILDRLLGNGFPRRPLIRALALIRNALVSDGVLQPGQATRVIESLSEALTRRLLPETRLEAAIGARGLHR